MKFKRFILKIIHFIFCLFHPIKKRVLFLNYNYSDSTRAICEKMHELYPDYELVYLLPKDFDDKYKIVPNYVKRVNYSKLNFLRYLVSSFCVINCFEYEWYHLKRNNQFFIQCYHGDRGPKKVLYLRRGVVDGTIFDEFVTDLCIAASDYGEENFANAFNYKGEILKIGMPRNDRLVCFNEKDSISIKKKLGIENKKIVLYAPTFRDSSNFDVDRIVDDLTLLLDELGNEYVCLLRWHRVFANFKINEKLTNKIINISDYPDSTDLLLVTDILISDYSSIPYDYALLGRPIVLYLFDYETYINMDRELSLDILNIGLKNAKNITDLISILKTTTLNEFRRCDEEALSVFGTLETGQSSHTICEIINTKYNDLIKR